MADRDNLIELCDPAEVSREVPNIGIRLLPGRVAVVMHNPPQRNGIFLPVSGRCRADVGILAFEYDGLPAGTVVAVAPYRGAWFKFGGGEYRVYGVQEQDTDGVVMFWNNEQWRPAKGWLLVKREKQEGPILTNLKAKGAGYVDNRRVLFDEEADKYEVPSLDSVLVQSAELAEVE